MIIPAFLRWTLPLLVVATLLAPPDVLAGTAPITDERAREIAAPVLPSVVTVYTWTAQPGADGRSATGAGSGWVHDAEGHVLTNAHVVDDADRVRVLTDAGDLIDAVVVGTDWYQDIAVLRLDPDDPKDLPPPATMAPSADLRSGDPVIALGTPHGLYADTVSSGVVGAVDTEIDTGNGYSLRNLIRHGAVLSPGNSGGPLLTADGAVIGMNTASRRSDAPDAAVISFAVAAHAVVPVVDELLANGRVNRPWIGLNGEAEPGAWEVTSVVDRGPADAAGIDAGDRIVAVEGDPVAPGEPFLDLLYRHEPGDSITLTVERDGARRDATVRTDDTPAPDSP